MAKTYWKELCENYHYGKKAKLSTIDKWSCTYSTTCDIPSIRLSINADDLITRLPPNERYLTSAGGKDAIRDFIKKEKVNKKMGPENEVMKFYYSCTNCNKNEEEKKQDPFHKKYTKIVSDLKPKRIIFNKPATIVFWEDGTKTVVKLSKGEKFNKYNAFCAALAKKIFENNSRVRKIVESGIDQNEKKKDKKEKK